MVINERLLKKAQDAGARLAEAERQLQKARSEYHALVRRMHLAGGSLREMAQALDLSHQRVQQMVGGAGGSWWRRVWRLRSLKGNLVCTFCGRRQDQVAKLIAGPKVLICDLCLESAERILSGSVPSAVGSLVPAGERARARCSFCGKRRGAGRPLLTGPEGNICGECLNVCQQILIDSTP